jgi:hypothetical protein
MPGKFTCLDTAVDNTRKRIRNAFRTGDNSLKFVSFGDRYNIIYKLNKYHDL